MTTGDLAAGARNLLVNCAELTPGESVLIVRESAEFGWYADDASEALASAARGMGIDPTFLDVGAPDNDSDPRIAEAMDAHDCTVFMARIGDQDRFAEPVPGRKTVMSYARTAVALASAYGRCDHRALIQLKEAANDILLSAESIRVTCPLGTDLSGNALDDRLEEVGDVSVRRFPLGVPQPLSATAFSGFVALARYLTPTGSRTYDPPSLPIEGVVMAEIGYGRIANLHGEDDMVDRIRAHHKMVGEKFGIDSDAIHSFHAGIHPGSGYTRPAAEDPDRWSNSVFTNPRILHFHTCGAVAPAEICWMLIDHSLTVDGVALWQDGRLCADAFEATRRCQEDWPELATLIAAPTRDIGLGD